MRRSVLSFLGALVCAAGLWVVVNLSGEYQTTLHLRLVVDVPEDLAPASPLPREVIATVKGTGWQIVQVLWTAPAECRVAINEYDVHDRVVTIPARMLAEGVQLPEQARVVGMQPDSLRFTLEARAERTVPVQPVLDVRCAPGFEVVGAAHVEPESVVVSGAASLVRGVTAWRTRPLAIDGATVPLRRTIALSDTLAPLVRPAEATVVVSADVQEIGEREFRRVPVRIVNAPAGTAFRLEPRTVVVLVRGGAETLAGMHEADIAATVNYLALAGAPPDSVPVDVVAPPLTSALRFEPRTVRWFTTHGE